jgi:hypothetical protein
VYKNIFYTVQRALMKFEGHDNDNNNSFIKKIKNIGNEDFFSFVETKLNLKEILWARQLLYGNCFHYA